MLSVSNQTAVSEENPANASPVHTKMIEKINKINNLLNETISEYNLNNDVPQAYSALKRIEIDIRTLFDGLADHKFGEDEIRLVTNLCRKMNEDSVVQEIRYCYMEERLLEEEVRALPSVDNSKIANFTRERFSVGTSRKDSGQPENKNDEKTDDNEIKNETILKEVQIKSEEKEVVAKKVEIVEEEAKVEGSKLMEKIKERDNHEVEVQTKLESIELTTSVTVKMPKQEERKVDQEQMLELIAKMKEEFENFKLDEAYDFYTKFKNYPKTKKLPKADLIFHMEKLSEYKEMIGKIENNHKEAQAILKELQDEDGYILESVKKNFEIKYKIDGGLVSLKMEGVIDVPLFNMLALIYEMDAYDQWMPFCKETKQLKVVTTTSKAGWLKWSLPPPISNRETYVYGMGFNRLQVNGSVLIVARSIHNDLPLAHKIGVDIPETTKNTRIDLHYMGGSFTPISKDKIKMCLVTKFDPKIKFIPTSLINWVVRKAATFLLDILVKKATNFKGSLWEKRIQENREFYGWLETQINKYLNNQEANQQQGGK